MSRSRLFGTDGVRGVANVHLTADLAMRLGQAAGYRVHGQSVAAGRRPSVVIGRDTRLSGDMLESALAAGLASMGVDVLNVGIVPTPAVAQIVLSRGLAAGIVISASHNPFDDNGIKVFGGDGKKLPDSAEDEIASLVSVADALDKPTAAELGRVTETREPVADYVERVIGCTRDGGSKPLAGLRIVMDCANGAAYELGPAIFGRLGARVDPMHADPDGTNINDGCGSTRPQTMAAQVVRAGAHAGVAFDGDADRAMLADERGDIVDGDHMMGILALDLHAAGILSGDVVVATIMSNIGLERALAAKGIRLHRTDVGDRYVAEAMESLGATIGGEQSGHLLLPRFSPAGDGLVTALRVLRVMQKSAKPLSELASVVQRGPQVLESIRVTRREGWRDDPDIRIALERGAERLGNTQWLSVRASGTEQVMRVMGQGSEADVVAEVVEEVCSVIRRKLGTPDMTEAA